MTEDTTADVVRYVAMKDEGNDSWYILDKKYRVRMDEKYMKQEKAEDEASYLNADSPSPRPGN